MTGVDRRRFLGLSAAAGLAAMGPGRARASDANAAGIDISAWSPEYVRKIAGTIEVDTAAECAKIVPLNHKGHLTYWYVGPNEASPRIDLTIEAEFWEAF